MSREWVSTVEYLGLGWIMLVGLVPCAAVAKENSFERPLGIDFGVSCQDIKDSYEIEVVGAKGSVETLRLIRPESAFPGAYRIVVSCNAGRYAALVIMGEPSKEAPGAIEVLTELERLFGESSDCPPIDDESVNCRFFQSKRTSVVFTAARVEATEYALVYAPGDKKDVEE